jgi:MFS family permease
MKFWKELKLLPREIWILAFSTFINRAGTMVLPFLVLYLTHTLGFSAGKAASVLGIYGLVSLIVGPVSGALSDRYGPVKLMEGGLFLSGIVLLFFPLAHTYEQVLLATIGFSFFSEAFRPAAMALIPEVVGPELRKQAFTLVRLAINLGMSISPVLGGLLAESNFKLIFFADGITTLLAVFFLWLPAFRLRPALQEKQDHPGRKKGLRLAGIREVLRDRVFLALLLAILPVGIVFFQTNSTLPLYIVRDLHFSTTAFGLLMAINTAMIVLFEVPLNSATSHWHLGRAMSLGSLLFGVGFGALAWAKAPWSIALTIVIWTLGEMILFPSMSTFVSEISPAKKRGAYMGLFTTAFSLTFMVGPGLGVRTLEHFGSISLWGLMFALGAISAILMGRVLTGRSGGIALNDID